MDSRPQRINGVAVPYGASVSELRTSLHPPGPRAWAACVALGRHPIRDAFTLLVELAASSDWCYRYAAVEALANHPLGREAVTLLGARLGDPSPYVQRAACRAVSALELHGLHDAVVALLAAAEAETRAEALRALATLWQPNDFASIFARFNTDPSAQVRRQAAWTLRAMVNTDTWRHVFDAWRRDPVPRHRIWAAELAAAFGGREIVLQLRDMAHDPDGHVRVAVEAALRQLEEMPVASPPASMGEML